MLMTCLWCRAKSPVQNHTCCWSWRWFSNSEEDDTKNRNLQNVLRKLSERKGKKKSKFNIGTAGPCLRFRWSAISAHCVYEHNGLYKIGLYDLIWSPHPQWSLNHLRTKTNYRLIKRKGMKRDVEFFVGEMWPIFVIMNQFPLAALFLGSKYEEQKTKSSSSVRLFFCSHVCLPVCLSFFLQLNLWTPRRGLSPTLCVGWRSRRTLPLRSVF